MMFLIKYWKLIAPGIAVILLAGAFWYHGAVQYQKGVTDTQAANLVEQIDATEQATKDGVKNEKKFKSIPITDVDAYGLKRNWLRADEDR